MTAAARLDWADAAQMSPAEVPLRYRVDGWWPSRQRAFVDAIAEGLTVEQACRRVGLSSASAYALRKRAAGAAFAIAWRAAALHARTRLADALYSRAIDGYTETVTRPDGSVHARHKFDNRLAMATLTRLDRLAEDERGAGRAARLIEHAFDPFLDILEHGDAAEAAAFVAVRLKDDAAPDLAAVTALRQAERYLRDSEHDAALEARDAAEVLLPAPEIDAADAEAEEAEAAALAALDPAERQGWTAAEWVRAIAANLVTVTDPPDSVTNPELSQLPVPAERPLPRHRPGLRRPEPAPAPEPARFHVWRIAGEAHRIWYTCFPPPEGFDGLERGAWGQEDYWRSCTIAEAAAAEAEIARELEDRREQEAARRDECFGFDLDEEGAA